MPINDFQITEHFNLREFQCQDETQAVKLDPEIPKKLEILRGLVSEHKRTDTALKINSGYRTPEYNHKVGGAEKSQHLKGTAADVRLPAGVDADLMASFAEKAGFDGVGKYNSFVHCDVRGYTARWDNRK